MCTTHHERTHDTTPRTSNISQHTPQHTHTAHTHTHHTPHTHNTHTHHTPHITHTGAVSAINLVAVSGTDSSSHSPDVLCSSTHPHTHTHTHTHALTKQIVTIEHAVLE